MIAEVNNAFMGQWVTAAFSFIGGLCSIVAVASYFASRRELDEIKRRTENDIAEVKERLEKLEDTTSIIRKEIGEAMEKQTAQAERRAIAMHNRINPLTENMAAAKGSLEAFTVSFDNFTEVMKAMVQRERSTTECPIVKER